MQRIFHFFFVILLPVMWMMFRVIPLMWRAVRPSKVADMPAVVNTFWLRKGYEGLTFFGFILTPTQAEADQLNGKYTTLKNHEMIHLRQAQACGDSWMCFYILYIWYWIRIFCFGSLRIRRQLKHAAYLLNPFEIEAYRRMNDLHYLEQCEGGAQEWRRYAKMSLNERLQFYQHRVGTGRGNAPQSDTAPLAADNVDACR